MGRTGKQTPRISVEPERVATDGRDAADLIAAYGFTLDPWQRLVLDCWLGTDEHGNYTMTVGGLSVPRQNGKNGTLEAREFFGMIVNADRILHTAHATKTAKRSFNRMVAIFTDKRHP